MVNTGFNTQPPEGGWLEAARMRIAELVSTHSRPKAAGSHVLLTRPATTLFQHTAARRRLGYSAVCAWPAFMFQHTAARRRLEVLLFLFGFAHTVSTHSRPKAAGPDTALSAPYTPVSTHSRPKAAGASIKSLAPSGFAALISLSFLRKA